MKRDRISRVERQCIREVIAKLDRQIPSGIDIEFIMTACASLPALLDEIDILEEERDELKKLLTRGHA